MDRIVDIRYALVRWGTPLQATSGGTGENRRVRASTTKHRWRREPSGPNCAGHGPRNKANPPLVWPASDIGAPGPLGPFVMIPRITTRQAFSKKKTPSASLYALLPGKNVFHQRMTNGQSPPKPEYGGTTFPFALGKLENHCERSSGSGMDEFLT